MSKEQIRKERQEKGHCACNDCVDQEYERLNKLKQLLGLKKKEI